MSGITKKALIISLLGLFFGASIGYLCRPPAQIIGKLPFDVVMSRGSNLKGIKKIYIDTAKTSFNYLIFGGISGAILGAIVGIKMKGK